MNRICPMCESILYLRREEVARGTPICTICPWEGETIQYPPPLRKLPSLDELKDILLCHSPPEVAALYGVNKATLWGTMNMNPELPYTGQRKRSIKHNLDVRAFIKRVNETNLHKACLEYGIRAGVGYILLDVSNGKRIWNDKELVNLPHIDRAARYIFFDKMTPHDIAEKYNSTIIPVYRLFGRHGYPVSIFDLQEQARYLQYALTHIKRNGIRKASLKFGSNYSALSRLLINNGYNSKGERSG